MKTLITTAIIIGIIVISGSASYYYLVYLPQETSREQYLYNTRVPTTNTTATNSFQNPPPLLDNDQNIRQQSNVRENELRQPISYNKKLGEEFVLWDIKYKVLSAVDSGSRYGMVHTTPGKYIALTLETTNMGKERKSVNRIYLQDNQDRKYELDRYLWDLESGLRTYGTSDRFDGSIAPGITYTYIAPFEVARDATGLKLMYPSANGNVVAEVELNL